MKNFWKNIARKWRKWKFNHEIKNGSLKMTPKGIAFYEYVKRIAADELKPEDRIETYENEFKAMSEIMKRHLDESVYTDKELRRILAIAHTQKFAEAYRITKEMYE